MERKLLGSYEVGVFLNYHDDYCNYVYRVVFFSANCPSKCEDKSMLGKTARKSYDLVMLHVYSPEQLWWRSLPHVGGFSNLQVI